ncbi:MAG: hypothetical protein K0Q49_2196, partial [Haloplasmataceae bacterium]|nr:hypothetical protein [Haloplasmataceae bacterium]
MLVNTLNKEDVTTLLNVCNEFDQTSNELNFIRDKGNISDLLYYQDNKLISYLVIYPSYKIHEVIVMGFVHP